jgi:hypothetical protein
MLEDFGPQLAALFSAEDGQIGCGWCGADTALDGGAIFTRAGRTRLACEGCADVLSGRHEARMLERIGKRQVRAGTMTVEEFNDLVS